MRILSVHNRYVYAGGEDGVREAEAALLARHGHVVERYDEDNRRIGNLSKMRLGLRTLWSPETYRAVRRILRQRRVELVHVHNYVPLISPSVYAAARAEGAAVVQTLHNYRLLCPSGTFFRDDRVCEDCLPLRWKGPAVRHACFRGSRAASAAVAAMLWTQHAAGADRRNVDAYITFTEFTRAKLLEGGLPDDKVYLKPNFVDPDPGVGEHDHGFALYVGRISPEKGIVALARTWREGRLSLPLKIAGTGPDLEALRKEADGCAAIECLGFLDKAAVTRLMKDASFLVFPSRWYEGLPLTIVEAFAVGLPVVCAQLGSMPTLVAHERTGRLYPPSDPSAVLAALRRAAAEPDRMRRLGREARHEYLAKYTADRNYTRLMEIYEAALASAQTHAH